MNQKMEKLTHHFISIFLKFKRHIELLMLIPTNTLKK